jgi:putative restriction endonuclease
MTDGELSAAIGVHHRAAAFFLGVIQRYCLENRLPKLQALAVNKQTKVPGGGYLGERGRKSHQREVAAVTGYAWPARPPKFK